MKPPHRKALLGVIACTVVMSHGLGLQPIPKCRLPVAIQDVCMDLEQEMCAAWGPGHLLLLAEALADRLTHGGLHNARAEPFAAPGTHAMVGNEALVVLDVR
jgi:hypothetical protein